MVDVMLSSCDQIMYISSMIRTHDNSSTHAYYSIFINRLWQKQSLPYKASAYVL